MIRAKRDLRFKRRYSHPVDRSVGLGCDQTIVLGVPLSAEGYPEPLRRIRSDDSESGKNLVFFTNVFEHRTSWQCRYCQN